MASPPSSARRHGPPLFGAAPPSPTQGLGNSLHCLRCEVLAATYGPMIGHTVLPVDVLTLIQERWDKNERVFKSNDDDFHLPFGQLTSLDMHYLSITTMTIEEGETNWPPAPEQESVNMTECCQGYPSPWHPNDKKCRVAPGLDAWGSSSTGQKK